MIERGRSRTKHMAMMRVRDSWGFGEVASSRGASSSGVFRGWCLWRRCWCGALRYLFLFYIPERIVHG